MIRILPLALCLSGALTGCVANYHYMARGHVKLPTEDSLQATLFWKKDEGRLWYGKKYSQFDSDLTMRVCGQTPRIFSLSDSGRLELNSKENDLQVARLNASGELEQLSTPRHLPEGSNCGLVIVEGKPVRTDQMPVGTQPGILILCKNQSRPDRYPVVGDYSFKSVSRRKANTNDPGPDPCGGN